MFEIPTIKYSKTDEDAVLPYRNNGSDCSYIISSTSTKILSEDDTLELDTGLYINDIVKGTWAMLHSTDNLEGVEVSPKIIENSFRGSLKIVLYNRSNKSYLINPKDPIARMVFLPLLTIEPKFIEENDESL